MKKIVLICICVFAAFFLYAQDVIITKDAQRIEAKIYEVSKTEIRYKEKDNLDGPVFVLPTTDIKSITYSNGKVVIYNQIESISESDSTVPQKYEMIDNSVARVESFGGVLVFTDCMPIEPYEIIGDVSFNNDLMKAGGRMLGGSLFFSSDDIIAQYTDIRNGLVSQSVMANRQVEGILITLPKQGEGRATLIKFKESAGDKALAIVNNHLGMLVFTDCKPIHSYSFVGKIDKAGGSDGYYNNIRDRLIKKVQKKIPSAQGIIPHFVSGGNDSAEAIKF